jgi:two-component system, NarL family, invasion response regulator UvrY
MTRILLADDHEIVRRGVRDILVENLQEVIVGEAGDAYETLELFNQQEWDLAVLDITMPGPSGLELLKELKRLRPTLPVLILSMHPEDQYAMRLLKAGASGYLNKKSVSEELIKAVRKSLDGGRYVGLGVAEQLPLYLKTDPDKLPHEKLSDREFEVLRKFAAGKTTGEIAKELCLNRQTISTYRMRLLEKMHMKTNAELIRYAIQHRLVD